MRAGEGLDASADLHKTNTLNVLREQMLSTASDSFLWIRSCSSWDSPPYFSKSQQDDRTKSSRKRHEVEKRWSCVKSSQQRDTGVIFGSNKIVFWQHGSFSQIQRAFFRNPSCVMVKRKPKSKNVFCWPQKNVVRLSIGWEWRDENRRRRRWIIEGCISVRGYVIGGSATWDRSIAYILISQSKRANWCAQSGNALSFAVAKKVYWGSVWSHVERKKSL